MTQDDAAYTEPELRARLKEEVQAGDKGGRPGQWSARKAQLLVRRYEEEGGGYTGDGHRTTTQQHLAQWGAQDWHTAGGGADARGEDGTARDESTRQRGEERLGRRVHRGIVRPCSSGFRRGRRDFRLFTRRSRLRPCRTPSRPRCAP